MNFFEFLPNVGGPGEQDFTPIHIKIYWTRFCGLLKELAIGLWFSMNSFSIPGYS